MIEDISTSWHAYPKIFSLGHREVADLFLEPVLIEEKIDGSQISFGQFDGELRVRSKGADIDIAAPPKMFAKAVRTIESLNLTNGLTYRGEYLEKPKHNTLAYDRVPEKNIILFDINDGEESYVSRITKLREGKRLGLEVVPALMENAIITNVEQIRELLTQVSVLGGQSIEGVVIKNYFRTTYTEKKSMLGKFVSEAYKETHKDSWRKRNPARGDIVAGLISKYTTSARWEKAIQHLRESGTLTNSPTDIGALILEVQQDVFAEEGEAIQAALFSYFKKGLASGFVRGLPEWYKQRLLDSQFEAQLGPRPKESGRVIEETETVAG